MFELYCMYLPLQGSHRIFWLRIDCTHISQELCESAQCNALNVPILRHNRFVQSSKNYSVYVDVLFQAFLSFLSVLPGVQGLGPVSAISGDSGPGKAHRSTGESVKGEGEFDFGWRGGLQFSWPVRGGSEAYKDSGTVPWGLQCQARHKTKPGDLKVMCPREHEVQCSIPAYGIPFGGILHFRIENYLSVIISVTSHVSVRFLGFITDYSNNRPWNCHALWQPQPTSHRDTE